MRRPALTFKVRRRGLSPKRQREFDEWIAKWSIDLDGPVLDWDDVFGPDRDAERGVVLDIGFGHGESTIQMARAQPELDVIGVEVHDPGVVTVLDAIDHDPLPHVRVVHGDLVQFLRSDRTPVAGGSSGSSFPIRGRSSASTTVDSSATTWSLRSSIDWRSAVNCTSPPTSPTTPRSMQRVCDAEPRLAGGVVERPAERPLTRFEQRGLDEGRPAHRSPLHPHPLKCSLVPGTDEPSGGEVGEFVAVQPSSSTATASGPAISSTRSRN